MNVLQSILIETIDRSIFTMSQNRSNTTDGSKQQRLNILGQDEIDTLFRRPCFTDEEREQYFTLSSTEQEVLDELKKISLVAWQHINLHGRYEFIKSQDVINMQEIILELIKSSSKEKN